MKSVIHRTAATLFRSLLALAFSITLASAQTGSKATVGDPGDPPNLKRYEGSKIFGHVTERFTKYDFLLSPWKQIEGKEHRDCYEKKQMLEGSLRRLGYVIPDKERTVLEVHRNYVNELTASGWEVLFSADSAKELKGNFGYETRVREALPPSQLFEYPHIEETAYIAARRTDPDGDTYATVYTTRYDNGLVGPFSSVKPGMVIVKVDLIKPQAMQQRMVFVDAVKMKQDIATQGRVSLYGILFDFNKADLKPESKPTLDEIAKLLKDDAGLKLLVVGHTDNVGTLEFNKDLSSRRAAAVVRELSGSYGIAAERLHAEGIAFLAPVAPNDTDAGRAKNRRVELVRW